MRSRLLISIIFILTAFLLRSDSVFAQKVLQCAPLKATVNNDLEVKNDLQVDNNAILKNNASVANDLTVNKDIFAASGSQKIYLGPDPASPYIANNIEGILFKSNGNDNFLWQSPSGTNPDAMILRSGGGLPTDNGYNLQVFGQVSSYQLHTMGIHLDMQGGIGAVPLQKILKITNSDNAGSGFGSAIFHGANTWRANTDDNLIFSGLTNTQDIGAVGLSINTVSGNVGITTVNPQITLAIGDNDTGLKWNSDGNFSLYTNNSERIKIDPAGDITINNQLCLGGVCKNAWPAAVPETDPIWTAASANYYTQTNLQTSGQSNVHWGNLTNVPAGFADNVDNDTDTDAQVLSIAGDVISLTNGGNITLPAAAAENDPQVGLNTTNYASKWDGSALVASTIYDTGNIGIGTTINSAKLHVNGNGISPSLRIQVNGSSKLTVAANGGVSIGVFNDTPPANGLYVGRSAQFDGDTTLGNDVADLTTVNGDICFGPLCIKYLASKRIYCDNNGSCDDQPDLPGCHGSVGVMPSTVHLSKGVKDPITDYFCKWKGGAVTGYDDCEGGGSDESYSDYECRYFEIQ